MKRKPMFDPNDPYSIAIKSLVKKTLIAITALVVVTGGVLSYVAVKSGLKLGGKSKTPLVTMQPEVLSQATTPQPTLVSTPSQTPISSQTPTQTSTPLVMPSQAASQSASPRIQSTPTATPTQTPKASPTPNPKIKALTSESQRDGYIYTNTSITNTEIRAGSMRKSPVRGYLSFDISSLSSEITSAKIRIYQLGVINDPFQNNTDIRADIVNYGSSLDPGDYATASQVPSFAVVTKDKASGWREFEVTEQLKMLKSAGKQYLQIRLHANFESEGNDNYVMFESADNSQKSNNIPELQIETK